LHSTTASDQIESSCTFCQCCTYWHKPQVRLSPVWRLLFFFWKF